MGGFFIHLLCESLPVCHSPGSKGTTSNGGSKCNSACRYTRFLALWRLPTRIPISANCRLWQFNRLTFTPCQTYKRMKNIHIKHSLLWQSFFLCCYWSYLRLRRSIFSCSCVSAALWSCGWEIILSLYFLCFKWQWSFQASITGTSFRAQTLEQDSCEILRFLCGLLLLLQVLTYLVADLNVKDIVKQQGYVN